MNNNLPQDQDIERSILGECMLDDNALLYACEHLEDKMFYNPKYGEIFKVLKYLLSHDIQVNVLVLIEELKRVKQLEVVGGEASIHGIISSITSAAFIKTHCGIIKDKYQKRSIISMCQSVISTVESEGEKASSIINTALSMLDTIAGEDIKRGFKTVQELLHPTMEMIIDRNKSEHISGIPTGFPMLDQLTNGFQNGDTIIIGAAKKEGKTMLGICFAMEAALKEHPVGIFSLEMTNRAITERIISNKAKVNTGEAHYKKLHGDQIRIIVDACNSLYQYDTIVIDDSANLNITDMGIKAKRMKKLYNIELLIVDYIQLMPSIGREGRQREIEIISHGLKALAKNLNIPVIIISQLARPAKGREKAPPLMTDLRDSGALEADSSLVLLIHNPDIKRKKMLIEKQEVYWDEDDARYENLRELIVAANRSGRTGGIPVLFQGQYSHFGELI